MLKSSKKNLLDAVLSFMEKNDINTQSIKSKNPLPVSARWVDTLIKSVKNGDNTGFNKNKVIELLNYLVHPFELDGNVLIIEKSDSWKPNKIKTSGSGCVAGHFD